MNESKRRMFNGRRWIVAVVAIAVVSTAAGFALGSIPLGRHTVVAENPVVILVIDDFGSSNEQTSQAEPSDEPTDPPAGSSDEMEGSPSSLPFSEGDNCLMTPDGLGHYGSEMFGSGSGQPHGELVYAVIRDKLSGMGNVLGSTTEDDCTFTFREANKTPSWLRDVELWRLHDAGDILLVAMDTQGFTTGVVSDQVEEATALLQGGSSFQGCLSRRDADVEGASRFVLNMSFGIVPCDSDPCISGRTDNAVAAHFADLAAAIEAASIENGPFDQDGFIRLYSSLLDDLGIPDDTQVRTSLIDEYKELLPGGSEHQDFTEHLDSGLSAKTLCYMTHAWPWVRDLVQVLTVYPHNQPAKSRDSFLENPDALDKLVRLLNSYNDTGRDITVISIGAAGNFGRYGYEYPFAPALLDSVVSVSAWDESCSRESDCEEEGNCQSGRGCRAAYSNPGEVAMDGTYLCPYCGYERGVGTSFAAPRLSLQAALYLLAGGKNPCHVTPAANPTIVPPLGYATESGLWKDLTLPIAAATYCPQFLSPIPTLTPTPGP